LKANSLRPRALIAPLSFKPWPTSTATSGGAASAAVDSENRAKISHVQESHAQIIAAI
jgi:hypothetical protein